MASFKKKPAARGTKTILVPTSDATNSEPPGSPVVINKLRPALVPMLATPGQPAESRIGDRIKHARNDLGLSIEGLSRYTRKFDRQEGLGITATTLLRYEKGDTLPGARELRILCDAFGAPSRWLLFGQIENHGNDELEQSLLSILDRYVRMKANEFRLESGRSLQQVFDPFSDANRLTWLTEARKPTQSE